MSAPSTVVVGAGIVGLAVATSLAQRGHRVEVFERRPDPRGREASVGRSVSLTLCTRGLVTLDALGLGAEIRDASVPVRGRVIHDPTGGLEFQPYGNRGECLHSIARRQLWVLLAGAAERNGVPLRFGASCVGIAPEHGRVQIERAGAVETVEAELVVGADGANSTVRQLLIRRPHVQYSQRYSEHANKELTVPAGAGLAPNVLHIWPRGQFMLIAFPRLDGSTSCTLHLPLHGPCSFAAIREPSDLESLFATRFPDVRPLMPTLVEDYFSRVEIPMVTVRCSPLTFGGRVVLIGDAAHAIWPSYGQGANAGFEDCAVLGRCLDAGTVPEALAAYDRIRRPDVDAIADLSEHHFEEIRDQVGDPMFLARKRIERRLNQRHPEHYVPLYARVAFTTTPYAEAVRIERRQEQLVDRLLASFGPEVDLDEPEPLQLTCDTLQIPGPPPVLDLAPPASERLRRFATSYVVSQSLYVMATLDLAEQLAGGPRTAEDVAREAGLHGPSVYRLFRALTDPGVLVDHGPEGFGLSAVGQLLRGSVSGSLRETAIRFGEQPFQRSDDLLRAVRTGGPLTLLDAIPT